MGEVTTPAGCSNASSVNLIERLGVRIKCKYIVEGGLKNNGSHTLVKNLPEEIYNKEMK